MQQRNRIFANVVLLALSGACWSGSAPAGELPLDFVASGDSTFYEYFSDGFFRMDLFSPDQPRNQSFRSISDPTIIYNQNFDGFPNDRRFRFGSITFNESGLVEGAGLAPITAVTLGIATDPGNPSYINWRRFTANTLVDSFSGDVEFAAGAPVSVDLQVDLNLEIVNPLGASTSGLYPGTFNIVDNVLDFDAYGTNTFTDTVFDEAELELRWEFGGVLSSVPPGRADFDDDGDTDGRDFLAWQRTLGDSATPNGSGADASGDGVIDAADLDFWVFNFGSGSAPAAMSPVHAIPEPTGAALALAGAAIASVRRRSR